MISEQASALLCIFQRTPGLHDLLPTIPLFHIAKIIMTFVGKPKAPSTTHPLDAIPTFSLFLHYPLTSICGWDAVYSINVGGSIDKEGSYRRNMLFLE